MELSSPAQKSIVADFLLSLNSNPHTDAITVKPSVNQWWNTVQTYMKKAGQKQTHVSLSTQLSDHNCTIGKTLKKSQISELAHRVNPASSGGLTLVLTAPDVAVEGFCNEQTAGFTTRTRRSDSVFIWVGNSATQCPGQCAWPFPPNPSTDPKTPPLVAPNADVGMDGMVVNIATLLAVTVTNPFATGTIWGRLRRRLEVASACTGVYGKGAYPGYAGELLVDSSSGASYNAVGREWEEVPLARFVRSLHLLSVRPLCDR
ncbi:hypothetical protein M0R45_027522 [Rubus argutus]|uniref:Uncharacterized protein n=1 Tax=Rubus argutus TaxID=59490 RepID=A0AAW1X0M4_RUBAR